MKNNLLQTIINVAKKNKIPIVIIGGLALPAYNVARTTLDVDICIYIKSQKELDRFINDLTQFNIFSKQRPKVKHDVFTVFGMHNEAEIWLKPCDAFNWDAEMINRIRNFFEDIYVLATEDYILTKLARTDRSNIDINDIFQILIANKNNLDWDYLRFRLEWLSLKEDFQEILKGFKLKIDKEWYKISNEIIDKFNKSKNKENSF
ncbi:MAG: DUF6036 family nucleotidyltransferase [Promethearchaeota archaeon]